MSLAVAGAGVSRAGRRVSRVARARWRIIAQRHYRYVRFGHDERDMELLPRGRIGRGAGGLERGWRLEGAAGSGLRLVFEAAGEPICRLRPDGHGGWRGRWLRFERMPVVLYPRTLRREDYLLPHFARHLRRGQVGQAIEVGCGDGSLAPVLRDALACRVAAFEPHPGSARRAAVLLADEEEITLAAAAAWDREGEVPFYPVTNGNAFASSCLRADGGYPYERYEQEETRVPAIRLDAWCQRQGISRVDLLCVDVQGAILQVLRGSGDLLRSVRWVLAEVALEPIYRGEASLDVVAPYLAARGLRLVTWVTQWGRLPEGGWLPEWGAPESHRALRPWWGNYLFQRATPGERAAAAAMARRRRFRYRRVGHDERLLELLPGGRVGRGGGGCERLWWVEEGERGLRLVLSDGRRLTCRLERAGALAWRGRWLIHEQMPVELEPLPATAAGAGR